MTDLVRFALTPGLALALAAPLAAGCDGGSSTNVHSYVDSSSRSCTVDLNDVSGTATCNVDPSTLVTCASGTSPVFTTNDSYDSMTHVWTFESCAGCIDRASHTTLIQATTCANITCTGDPDCLENIYHCTSGICTHM